MNELPTLKLPGWPDYGEEEIKAVTDVLRNNRGNYWFGEEGKLFEQEFAPKLRPSAAAAWTAAMTGAAAWPRIIGPQEPT